MGKEYLVEGAVLVCVNGGDTSLLTIPEGHGYTSGGKKKANCKDCEACINIPYFGACRNNKKEKICEGYMELTDKWENIGGFFTKTEKVDGEEAITMNSVLLCKKGGLIVPVTSGQGYDRKIDWLAFVKRFAKVYMWAAGKKLLCQVFGGDPVNMNTGNFIYEKEELLMSGITSLSFRIFYNAMEEEGNLCLGEGWHHNHELHIREDNAEKLMYVCMNDGRAVPYLRMIGENYISLFGDRDILKSEKDGLHYCMEEGIEYIFNNKGLPIAKKDRNENMDIYKYNSSGQLVETLGANGGKLFYSYNTEGKLISIKDHTGREVKLKYRYGKLWKFINPSGLTYIYSYNENGKLESVMNPSGEISVWNVYDGANRIVKQMMPDGGMIELAYDDVNMHTYLKEQNGNMITYVSDSRYRNIKTIYKDGEATFEYNDKNQLTLYADKKGNIKKYRYDSNGNVIEIENALGNKLNMDYDEYNRKIISGVMNNWKYKYVYDDKGNICAKESPEGYVSYIIRNCNGQPEIIIQPDGSRISIKYDKRGNIIQLTDAMDNKNKYEYDDLNRIIAVYDGNAISTKYQYDKNNNIVCVQNPLGKKRRFVYNKNKKIVSVTDYDGYKVQFLYGPNGKKTKYINKEGAITEFEYDKMGNIVRIKQPNGGERHYEYNSLNQLVSFEDAANIITRFEYDQNGNRTKVISHDGSEVLFYYDALNRLVKIIESDGLETTYEYNNNNQLIKVKYPGGYSEEASYDNNGKKVFKKDIYGNITYCKYNALGLPTEMEDSFGRKIKFTFYPGGILKKAEFPDGRSESYIYDGNKNIIQIKKENGYIVYFTYDALNRVIEVKSSLGERKCFVYDDLNRITEIIDAYGNIRKFSYSPEGNMLLNEDPLGSKLILQYDNMGQLSSMEQEEVGAVEDENTDANKAQKHCQTLFDRDLLGRIIGITDAFGNREIREYDNKGRLIKKTDREGFNTCYSYNISGCISKVQYADGTYVNYKYNSLRQLTEVEDSVGSMSIEPDIYGRIKAVTDYSGRMVRYDYGIMGERKSIIYPDGKKVNYYVDNIGRLSTITDGDDTYHYYYDQCSRLIMKQFPNGLVTTYGYNDNGKLMELIHRQDTAILERFTYKYDLLGNKTTIIKERKGMPEESGIYNYDYDKIGRLIEVRKDGNKLREYEYDSFGNRTCLKEKEKVTGYCYNSMNQVTKKEIIYDEMPLEQFIYKYDKRGNLVQVEQNNRIINEYFFGPENRLDEALNKERDLVKYTYNGLGKRIKRNVIFADLHSLNSDYILDITKNYFNILEEVEGDKKQRFVWDKQIIALEEDKRRAYYIVDELGSPIRMMGKNGKEYEKLSYEEFGKGPFSCKQPFGYTGYVHDNITGTYFAQTREYASEDGRFTGEDSVRYKLNWYTYCSDNPLRYIDPMGLHDCHCEEDIAPDWLEFIMGCERYGYGFIGNTTRIYTALTQSGVIDDFLNTFMGFKREGDDFHIRQDSWQKYLGYNDLYDFGFDAGTDMQRKKFEFTSSDGEDYMIWMWKGDYINLGAGAETGIYNDPKLFGLHWEAAVEEAMPMSLTVSYEGEKIVDYRPGKNEPKWWVTGFDPMVQGVCASDLQVTGTIDFSGEDKENMWTGFKNTYDTQEYSDMFTFDDVNKTVTYNW